VVGFVAYEAAPAFDPALVVPHADPACPLAWFAVFDSPDPAAPPAESGRFRCTPWRLATGRPAFDQAIESIRAGITAGDYYQVNYTSRCRAGFTGDPAVLFEALRQAQPNGYGCFIDGGEWQLLSVSPELFFDWRSDGTLSTRPMKGTAPRHADAAADARAAAEMQASAKERAENLMIVDLLRNDLARIAVLGTVRVPRLFQAEALPTAWQMTSTVECATRPGTGLPEVFAALFPCGSVTGAPKIAAMASIARLEEAPRGIYCGAIGLIRPGGHATFSVGIRSVWLRQPQGSAECGIGSGITLDSTADGEYAEWLVKRRFLMRATAGFELIETLRLEAGRYWLLEGHWQRLWASAMHFGFPLALERFDAALAQVAENHPTGSWRIRLLVDRRGHVRTEAHALEVTSSPVTVSLAHAPMDSGDEFLRHKTTERTAYDRHAPPGGSFDTLLWNEYGHVTEFIRGNVVVELEGRRLTPPVADGLLPGVLRADLLARGEIVEQSVARADLKRATGLWFINSVRGWLPARLAATGHGSA
jgi:para-aminobenzoate synthetase/4-amino-4-deoxychorismate lyase